MKLPEHFNEKLEEIGPLKLTLLIVLFSVIGSIIIDISLASLMGASVTQTGEIFRAIVIPLILSPTLAWAPSYLIGRQRTLQKELTLLASYDDLTGLYNRREFYKNVEEINFYALRHKQHSAALIIDIDYFKKINDHYGHAAGDIVLAEFGRSLLNLSRAGDIAGRLGGEEFGLFLPNTNLGQAEAISQRLLKEISESEIASRELAIKYTISIGVAVNTPNAPSSIDVLFKNADQALYAAKANGRNQTSSFPPS